MELLRQQNSCSQRTLKMKQNKTNISSHPCPGTKKIPQARVTQNNKKLFPWTKWF